MKTLAISMLAWVLGIGIVNAAPSVDCGDDEVQPIELSKAVK